MAHHPGIEDLPPHIKRRPQFSAAGAGSSSDADSSPPEISSSTTAPSTSTTSSTTRASRVKQVFHVAIPPTPPPEVKQDSAATTYIPPHLKHRDQKPDVTKSTAMSTTPMSPTATAPAKFKQVWPATTPQCSLPKPTSDSTQQLRLDGAEFKEKEYMTMEEFRKIWVENGKPPAVFCDPNDRDPPSSPPSERVPSPQRRPIKHDISKPPPRTAGTYQSWSSSASSTTPVKSAINQGWATPPSSPERSKTIVNKLADHGVRVWPSQPAQKKKSNNGSGRRVQHEQQYNQHQKNKQQAKNTDFQSLLKSSRGKQHNPKPRNERWPKPRESRWPTKADFPKVRKQVTYSNAGCSISGSNYDPSDPDKIRFTWFEHDFVDNNAAPEPSDNGGWSIPTNGPVRQVGNVAYSLGTYDYGFAPPPLDWDNRPAYASLNSTKDIETWLGGVEDCYPGIVCNVLPTDNSTDGLMAPRSWIPRNFGKQTAMDLWGDMMRRETSPPPVDERDLVGVRPWWAHYQSEASEFVQPITHPEEAGIDPYELESDRIARENDYGNLQHADNLRRREWAKATAKADRRAEIQGLKKKFKHVSGYEGPLRPGINMYVRAARIEDLMQIRDIYNYYVDVTTTVRETDRVTAEFIDKHLKSAEKCGLPFLVAVERGRRITFRKLTRNDRDEFWMQPDKIIGFIFAHNSNGSLPDDTAELKVFTAQAIHRRSAAKCLMDKFLALTDPKFPERAGYQLEGSDMKVGTHIQHPFKRFWVEFLHHEDDHLGWITGWLKEYKYKLVKRVKGAHVKHKRDVHIAEFCYNITTR